MHLKRSKCDQFGQGVNVFVGRTNLHVCPVAAVLAYIAVWGAAEGPFFQFANGQLATKQAEICFHISSSSPSDRPPITRLAGDSFCIGAATAKAGIEDSVIRTLGRWNSAAFLTYIRTPRESLARFSSRIAS